MDLNALREFTAIASEGSFAAAARKLGTPKSTVSKRIQDLEAALGVRLIERTTRKLSLTPEGALVLSRAKRILADAGEITRALSPADDGVAGHLRIAAPVLFGQSFMGQIVAVSRRVYPDLTIEVVLTDSQPDLVEEGFDAALRVGHPHDTPFVSRTIAQSHRVAVAAPQIVARKLEDPADLAGLPVLFHGVGLVHSWHFVKERQDRTVRLAGGVAMTSYPALKHAALGGAGVAQLPLYLVEQELAQGQLVEVLDGWQIPPGEIVFVYPGPQALTARMRAFLELLENAFPDGTLHGGVLRSGM
ncbi:MULTISPECIES: LysR family transcriptional regulator [unclassified Meridianimarinicoccus]|uniref:LysR family transcriptional regulator n=1 Tax=unclassified Meridianimarinicoccus TaxID=2923344 RepID=UPI001866DF3A|nr:LysR family transcriptional regulator [Fluviibacterium sp. MJW13]